MVTIGSVAAHNARSTFVTNLLASGGIEAVLDADEQRAGTATVDGSPGAQIVVLAGSDAGYAEEGETLARSLREQGYLVLLAGAPGTVGDGLIDFYLHAKIDAAAVLDDLLTRLGA
ncbi:methylmalonyl-CoA mutase OS=Tsukamurella paurometabola (strain ATCC 8368 / DSM / CCUG 35730/ CIP 100753 / JCM 10117 / KCTC 9821 / NBRC 16120 / NCIMB 702349/ NCTC 13040) OX=521096 GN=Tpau_2104 PE=4 SV=1 [Tsukamurella paurometabola]